MSQKQTHGSKHTLDLVITFGMSTIVSSVADLDVFRELLFISFTSHVLSKRRLLERTVRKQYKTSEVAANFKPHSNLDFI